MTARQQITFEAKVTELAAARQITRQQAAAILVAEGITAEIMPR
jgi:hypothetical protein